MYELDLVLWACGSTAHLSDDVVRTCDFPTLLMSVQNHRLSGRFLDRLDHERPSWATESLQDALQEQQRRVTNRLERQLTSLQQIRNRYSEVSVNQKLVVVKGITAYALAGEAYMKRSSSDMDIFATDTDALLAVMTDLGYCSVKEIPAPHEVGVFKRDEIKFDVHRYFPSLSYPSAVTRMDLRPDHNRGIWIQDAEFTNSPINLSDILRNSAVPVPTEMHGLTVPDPSMAVLIQCSHVFRHYCENLFMNPKAALRLVDILEIKELLSHRNFSSYRFATLVKIFAAEDAVNLTAHLVRTLLGANPFSSLSFSHPDEHRLFPNQVWYGFWSTLDWTVEELLILVPQRLTSNFVYQLGGNTIEATMDMVGRTYTALVANSGQALERVIVRQAGGERIPFELGVTWTEPMLTFELTVHRPLGEHRERIRFCFGEGKFCTWVHDPHKNETFMLNIQGETTLSTQGDRYLLRLSLPWSELAPLSPSSAQIPMLIGLTREALSDDTQKLTPGTLVPLNLVLIK